VKWNYERLDDNRLLHVDSKSVQVMKVKICFYSDLEDARQIPGVEVMKIDNNMFCFVLFQVSNINLAFVVVLSTQ
jgi:hypothetical protein